MCIPYWSQPWTNQGPSTRPVPGDDSAEPASPGNDDDAFDTALHETLIWEGGKDDDPRDPGGRTAFGIIQREYDAWRDKQRLPRRDVWNIDRVEVRTIYRENYWEPLRCDQYVPAVAYAIFDYGVNSGNAQATRDAQRAAKCNLVDGKIGPATVAAVKATDPRAFILELDKRRLALLENLPTWDHFGRGWTDRVNGGRDFALNLLKK